MWIVDHQMNLEASETFGRAYARIPLAPNKSIICANAATLAWDEVIRPENLNFIIGNPPFSGSRKMDKSQKEDLRVATRGFSKYKSLDYVCVWYFKAAQIMAQNNKIQTCFVSTNSVTQGLIASLLWRAQATDGLRIKFAHQSFRWTNKAKGVAQVHCVIIGLSFSVPESCTLYEYEAQDGEPIPRIVPFINPYLLPYDVPVIAPSQQPISPIPGMSFGNMPDPAKLLVYEQEDATRMIEADKSIQAFFLPAFGATEALQNRPRQALWLKDVSPSVQRQSALLDKIVSEIRSARLVGARPENANLGGAFAQITQNPNEPFLLIPRVFVAKLRYIPCVYLEPGNVSLDSALVVPNAPMWLFALLVSDLHLVWLDTVGGKMKSDYRYSKELVYNTFPLPGNLEINHLAKLEDLGREILKVRSHFSASPLADLYHKNSIPSELNKAHSILDKYVFGLYGLPSSSDTEAIARELLEIHHSRFQYSIEELVYSESNEEPDLQDED
jgi:hypothetical protein